MDAELPFAWATRSQAFAALSRWKDAEAAARQALELDPDNEFASNLLAHALRVQGRLAESEEVSKQRLARDPENAFSFATSGWAALQRGDPKKAEELFREALRLDPEQEYARDGLRETFKARSFLYRGYLRWCFFMQKHSKANQWAIIIGIYLAYRFGRVMLDQVHPLAAAGLVVLYLFFAFGSWLANGIGNFLLLKDPVARMSLNRREKIDGLVIGGLFVAGLVIALLGVTVLPLRFAFLGAVVIGAAVRPVWW